MPRSTAGHRERKSSVGGSRAGLLGPRPDEGVALALFVVEEVRVDRSVEARIVKLDREVVALFRGALGPGGADLGAANNNAARRISDRMISDSRANSGPDRSGVTPDRQMLLGKAHVRSFSLQGSVTPSADHRVSVMA